jgi:rhomboid protease GluP
MAFGFSPKYRQDLQLAELTQAQFLVVALETAKELGWNVGCIHRAGFVAFTRISGTSWSEEFTLKIEDNVAHVKSECAGNQLTDWGKNKQNVGKFTIQLSVLVNSLTVENLNEKYAELLPVIDTNETREIGNSPISAKGKINGLFSIFKPTKGYFVTPILINLNIAIFLVMALSGVGVFFPDSESLVSWGANFRPLTLNGEWWRLVTNCFLHIGIFHLLMNMYALLYIGILLEPYLGRVRFLALYLLTGIAASVASLWWHDLTISAGASGAIFGMYGIFLALLTTKLIDESARKPLLTSILIFVGYNILNGVKGGIDNAAHIGGVLSGIILGYSIIPSIRSNNNVKLKYLMLAILSFVTVVLSSAVYKSIIPYDIAKYETKMKEFETMENKALDMYRLADDVSSARLAREVKDKSIYYWKENVKLVNGVNKLYLPSALYVRNQTLLHYCELRIRVCELILKAIKENRMDVYQCQIEDYNQQIESVINELAVANKS